MGQYRELAERINRINGSFDDTDLATRDAAARRALLPEQENTP